MSQMRAFTSSNGSMSWARRLLPSFSMKSLQLVRRQPFRFQCAPMTVDDADDVRPRD